MNIDANKAIVRRIVAEVWNGADLSVAEELFAPGFSANGETLGPEGVRRRITRGRAAFPDGRYVLEDLLAEGDRVVARWTHHGTQLGELITSDFGRTAPTGKPRVLAGINIFRIADGKAAEVWQQTDALGGYRQLGLLGANTTAATQSQP